MICSNPYVKGGQAFACGGCLPCRINRRRIWTHRIMLEAAQYKDNTFATLTFDEDNIPNDHSVRPTDLQLFFKRFRKALAPQKCRYFACGEYGEETQRPHYHAAIFGYPNCTKGITSANKDGYCCSTCEVIRKAWGNGNVYLAPLESGSAAYIAGYVTKKWTKRTEEKLEGREPEFARMSLRPGIGLGMMDELASTLMEHRLDEKMIDVPLQLQHGRAKFPLGRYLRRQLRKRIGREENAPKEIAENAEKELQYLRETAHANSPVGLRQHTFKQAIVTASEGQRINLLAREHRKRKRGSV